MSALIEAAGWALLHSLWQGALLAGLVALALRWVDRRAAALRYALACAALALLPLLVAGTAWHLYTPASPSTPASSDEPCCEAVAPVLADELPRPLAVTPALPAPSPAAPEPTALGELLQAQVAAALPWLVLAWALGVALSSLRLVRSHARLRRLVQEAEPAKPEWQERLTQLAQRMGLSRPVTLLETQGLDSPATLGWLVPVVLVPVSALAGLSPRQLEMVLAHELAHIRRHDFAVNLVQAMVETLFFYHPAVAWLGRTVREEREHCCDDLAVAACGNAVSYARALTALESLRLAGAPPALPALYATGGSLADRVRRLVLPPRVGCGSRWLAGASALTLASSLAVAAPLSLLVLPAVVPPPELFAAPENELIRSSSADLLAQNEPTPQGTGGSSAAEVREAAPADEVRPAAAARAPVPAPAARAARSSSPAQRLALAAPPAPSAAPAAAPAPAAEPAPAAAPVPLPAPVLNRLAWAGEKDKDKEHKKEHGLDKQKPGKQKHARDDADDALDARTKVGEDTLSVEQLINLRNAGITGQRVQELRAMGFEPTVQNLVQLGHAGVTSDYAKQMKSAFGRTLSMDELVSMRHMGVSPAFIAELSAQGYKGLAPDEVIGARAVGVNEQYIRELGQLGYKQLPLERVMEMRAVGVSTEYVKELQQLGFQKLSVDQLTELRAHGVSASYVRSLKDAGFTQLGVDEVVRLRAAGVDADFARELQKGKRK